MNSFHMLTQPSAVGDPNGAADGEGEGGDAGLAVGDAVGVLQLQSFREQCEGTALQLVWQ